MSIDLGSILGSVLTGGTGGLIGILGNFANTMLAMKQQKQQNDFNIAMLPLQLNADIERTKAEVAKVTEAGAAAAFTASQEADKVTGRESVWVLDVKAMVRPTCLFLLGAGVVALLSSSKASANMVDYIIQNIVTDFSMALSWYFGARALPSVMSAFKSKAGN